MENLNSSGDRDHAENSLTTDEKFLGSVSAFIRRCFEYADPSHPENQKADQQDATAEATEKLDSFAIGDDEEEEDLIDIDDDAKSTNSPAPDVTPQSAKSTPAESDNNAHNRSASESANPALDPNNPLHITLPTFRMVVLADELLEQFFESYFHLSDHPHPAALAASSSMSSNLTTFSNLGSIRPSGLAAGSAPVAGASGGIVPPGKGLRGVLDNIVSDGIRMAAEVKKRMDEAQRDLERNALGREEEEDDDDDDDYPRREHAATAIPGGIPSWGAGAYGADPERRSVVRDTDRDLLEGAEVLDGGKEDKSSLLDGKDNANHAPRKVSGSAASAKGRGSPTVRDGEVISKLVDFES